MNPALVWVGAFIILAALLTLALGWLITHWIEWRQAHRRFTRFEDVGESVRKAERDQQRRSG